MPVGTSRRSSRVAGVSSPSLIHRDLDDLDEDEQEFNGNHSRNQSHTNHLPWHQTALATLRTAWSSAMESMRPLGKSKWYQNQRSNLTFGVVLFLLYIVFYLLCNLQEPDIGKVLPLAYGSQLVQSLYLALPGIVVSVSPDQEVVGRAQQQGPLYQQAPPQPVDYDQLVDKLLGHPEFLAMVKKISAQETMSARKNILEETELRMGKLRAELEPLWARDLKALEESQAGKRVQAQEKISGRMEAMLKEAKTDSARDVDSKIEKEISELKLQMQEKLKELANVKTSANAKAESRSQTDSAALTAISNDIQDLQSRISNLQSQLDAGKAEVAKCCSKSLDEAAIKSQIQGYLKNEADALTEELKTKLGDKFMSQNDLSPRIDAAVERLRADLHAEFDTMISRETKASVQNSAQAFLKSFNLEGQLRAKLANELSANASINSDPTKITSMNEVNGLVQEALKVYDADKTGMYDFALESAGGSVINTRCTETHDISHAVYSVFGVNVWWDKTNPRLIIQPGAAPGQCWAFKGTQGAAVVRLASRIHVHAITIEHMAKMVSPDGAIKSAPKDFGVYGLRFASDEKPLPLGNFTYLDNGVPVQTFPVEAHRDIEFDLVELKVYSNHGSVVYTCLYRFRVHGVLARLN